MRGGPSPRARSSQTRAPPRSRTACAHRRNFVPRDSHQAKTRARRSNVEGRHESFYTAERAMELEVHRATRTGLDKSTYSIDAAGSVRFSKGRIPCAHLLYSESQSRFSSMTMPYSSRAAGVSRGLFSADA
uniref:Uncharacterized protein n=1 Tax=Mycena chlorophos TaxID=658473 RepID=A0ABQ0L5K6_MYCCL|nr:predicted protein [Mycena chlorophos]